MIIDTRPKKKKRPLKVTRKPPSRITLNAAKLNSCRYPSERWFQNLWKRDMPQHRFHDFHDLFNYPQGRYIPDVVNLGYKYIIEVDGSIHTKARIQWKDKQKTRYYEARGFVVYRVKAFDMQQYDQVLNSVRELIKTKDATGNSSALIKAIASDPW